MPEIGERLKSEIPRLRRDAQRLTQSSGRAEDLVQSCLVRALNKQHLWREGTDLRAWLFTILHNEFVSQTRRLALERSICRRRRQLLVLLLCQVPIRRSPVSCRSCAALAKLPFRQGNLVCWLRGFVAQAMNSSLRTWHCRLAPCGLV
jgi:DNA-directed RNA polymerase specialized sigma24 family protein